MHWSIVSRPPSTGRFWVNMTSCISYVRLPLPKYRGWKDTVQLKVSLSMVPRALGT